MKRPTTIVLGISLLLNSWAGVCPTALAGEDSSSEEPSQELIDKGEKLFVAKGGALGTKYACILCHQKEKAIKKTDLVRIGDDLPDVINGYLVKKAKGAPLAKESEEMKALMAYIQHKHSV